MAIFHHDKAKKVSCSVEKEWNKHEERSNDKGRWKGTLVPSSSSSPYLEIHFPPVLPSRRHLCIHLRVHFYLLLQKTVSSLTRCLVNLMSGWLVSLEIQGISGLNWGHFPNPAPYPFFLPCVSTSTSHFMPSQRLGSSYLHGSVATLSFSLQSRWQVLQIFHLI